jgi:ketosteroid isomerase-like protein
MGLDPKALGSDIQQRLTRLESIEAIKQLQVEYASACDAGLDADRIAALFADDGVWEGGSPPTQFVGRAAVRQHFVDAKSFVRWTFHLMIGPHIHIHDDGRNASGSWYLLEPATFAENGDLRTYWLASTYDMEYVRADSGAWSIRRMTLKPPLRAAQPAGFTLPPV